MDKVQNELSGQAAIITGAGSGVGRAIAQLFAAQGARVVVADIDERTGEGTVAAIRAKGGEAILARTDVSNADDVEKMVRQALDAFGRLDILVNNAGIGGSAPVEETLEATWDAMLAVNLKGVFLCSKAAIPPMRKQGGGCILNMASVAGLTAVPGAAAYCASKGAVVLLTKQMALDYAKDNIRVSAVCPGSIDTPLMQGKFDRQVDPLAARREYEARLPMGRMLDPREVAYVFLFLASQQSTFLTGQCMVV